jgi:hypothetical protein
MERMEKLKALRKPLTMLLALTLLFHLTALIPVKAYGCPSEDFNVLNVNVRSSADTPNIYPGSGRAYLKVEAAYLNITAAKSVVGWLKTPEGVGFSSGSGSCSPAHFLNGTVAEEVKLGDYVTFEYLLDVSDSLSPGSYGLLLNITYLKGGYPAFETHNISLKVSPYPPIALRVVEAYFSPASYPGSSSTNLYVVLENAGYNSISSANFKIELPENFAVENPRASSGLVNRGDRFTLTFSGISISPNVQVGVYSALLFVDANARTEDGVSYSSSISLNVPVHVENPPIEEPLMVAAVNTLYNGDPSPLLPSARNVVLRVYLVNKLAEALSALSVNVMLPGEFHVRAVSGTYINGISPGGSCFVDITVEVDSGAVPKIYEGKLQFTYLKMVGGSSFLTEQTVSLHVNVESFHSYVPEISLVNAYWGSPEPTPAYSTSRYVPLTVRLINQGRYSIEGVFINASSPMLRPIKNYETCSATLAPGAFCTAVLYFDLETEALNVQLEVTANYKFTAYGTHVDVFRSFNVSLPVESYPASGSVLTLVDAGWLNSVYVFPKTANATYQITLANRSPYSIAGVNLELKLPTGLYSSWGNKAKAYFDGPVRSLASFTVSFKISVGDVPPKSYIANLTVDCLILSGGPGVKRVENFTIFMAVVDDESALQVLDSRWYEGSVGPYTYGAHLIVLVRNVYVDGLKGAVLEINLPRGIYNSADNSSIVKATPVGLQLPQSLQAQNVMEVLTALLNAPQASQTQQYNRGDVLGFTAALNLFDVDVGDYKFEGRLSYIDYWGGERKVRLSIPVSVLGRAGFIEIAMDKSVSVRSRFINTSLCLKNLGSSPIYDVYIVVSPYQGTPILIATPAISHVENLGPGKSLEIPITLAYNPLGFFSQAGGTTSISYGPVPLMISVIYRDVGGFSRIFNNSITVTVEPFIELDVRNIRAVGKASSSTVTGIILNYGSTTAYRVEVELKIGNTTQSSFIGDVDPGSEVAFKVDIECFNNSATLTVKYYNVFNEVESKKVDVKVQLQEEEAPPATEKEQPLIERWIIVAGVLIFLAAAIFLIYRITRKSRHMYKN